MAVGVDYKNWRNLPAEVRREVQGRYYRKDDSPRQCSGCGEVFQPGYADKRRKWCSLRCKLAHMLCNSRRGARGPAQLGLPL